MKTTSESNEHLVASTSSVDTAIDPSDAKSNKAPYDSIDEVEEIILTPVEKKFLLTAERGDCAGVRRYDGNKPKFRNQ